ncbi:patatin-like phospholipase family protein [Lacinutrix sp. 5H-3-7-4]|uniref:patatin-like phospholipase family protein n=1 Tax=Lacinutrix sp. (strain 5H-3-7-4) TaxID=983544 RepID=UPI00020A33B2|nr:patatin-like phospholipase family protein [Lacinutrix sp. 5H-3-7-4]AEH00663.1 Patatin [Lacinutrix sp. 5H-3-7-4]
MKRYIIVILLLLAFKANLSAQNSEAKEPKVGLVLSGGGAKGLAHIGALKVIDSLGIRVDYVAGTSMGAIVGSLYASGYSGKQLDSIFRSVDFDKIINDNIPRAAKTFYERENNEKYAVILPFNDFEIKLPSALSRGQNTFNLLSKLTMHVNDIEDFSKLPIPFFCIATNIENGQPVILDKGNLPQAIKASGAFPSLFQPVLIGDKLLIDGGVTNNYPIDELRAKGMDVIIGVDVQDGLANRTDLSSAPEILFQINNFRTINDMKVKAPKTDIYIKPDISKFTVVSFDDGPQIIKNGISAAKLKLSQLQKLADNQIKKPIEITNHRAPDSLQILDINIKGLENYTRSYVIGKLKLRPDQKVSYGKFISGTNNLVATNNFDSFTYKLASTTKNGVEGYNLNTEVFETEKTTTLKFGLHYDGLYKSALLANLTRKQLLFKSDVLSLDLIAGDNVRYNFEYYVDKGIYWSFGVKSRYNEFNKSVLASAFLTPTQLSAVGVNKLGLKLTDLTNRVFVQTQYKNDLALTLGLEHKHYKITTETVLSSANQTETTFDNSDYLSGYANFKYDSFDNKYYPNEGLYFNGDFNFYFYSSDFNNNFSEFSIVKADLGYAYSFSSKFSVNILAEAGAKLNAKNNPYLNFTLGGYANNFINNFKSFYGYDYLSIQSNSVLKGTINLDYEIFKKQHILAAANFANAKNNLFSTVDWFSLPDYSGYALGYGIETFLGPLEGRFSYSPESRESFWFFNLGFWF